MQVHDVNGSATAALVRGSPKQASILALPRCVLTMANALFFSICLNGHAAAQDADSLLRLFQVLSPTAGMLAGNRPEQCSTADSMWGLLQAMQKEERYQQRLKGELTFNFSSNEAKDTDDDQKRAKNVIGAGLRMDGGTYPGNISFRAGVGLALDEARGKPILTENISQLHAAYDYYAYEPVEWFAFVDRFANSFLEIDQRYEIGGGIVFEHGIGLTSKGARKLRDFEFHPVPRPTTTEQVTTEAAAKPSGTNVDKASDTLRVGLNFEEYPTWFQCYVIRNRKTTSDLPNSSETASAVKSVNAALEALGEIRRNHQSAIRKRHQRLRLAILLGSFLDVENATLQTTLTLPQPDPESPKVDSIVSININAEQLFRWEIRPTVEFRPTDRWHLRADYYYKRSFRSPGDYRMDLQFVSEFDLTAQEAGQAGGAKFVFSYRYLYDNRPPSITEDQQIEQERGGGSLARITARRSSSIFELKFSYTF